MQIPVARTFVPGELETAAYMNSLSQAVAFLLNPPRCKAMQSTTQLVPNAAYTAITFDGEIFDTDTMHNPVTNNSRITATTAGLYAVSFAITFMSNATGLRLAEFTKNGAAPDTSEGVVSDSPLAGDPCSLTYDTQIYLAANDYLEVKVYQTSGAALSTQINGYNCNVNARWVANS